MLVVSFPKDNYNGLCGNLCLKQLILPQKYPDIGCHLVFISTAKHGSNLNTQYCLLLICIIARVNFYASDHQIHNSACCDRAGAGRNHRAFCVYCSLPMHINVKVTHQLSVQSTARIGELLCFYISSWVLLKSATCSSLANKALLNMYYPNSIFIWKFYHNLISSCKKDQDKARNNLCKGI